MPKPIDAQNEHVDEVKNPGSDVLEMSDEDFMNANEESLAGTPTPLDEEGSPEVNEEEPEIEEDDLGDEEPEEDESDTANEEEDQANAEAGGSEQAEDDNQSEDEQPNDEANDEDTVFNYEAEYKKLFEPIKSSGRTIKLKNIDHAINLVQMGDDYYKKMHAIKPHMKTLKTLEKAGLLTVEKEERLNLFLEIENGNKDAMKRLVAESGIDVLDMADDDAMEQSKQYKPQNHMMSDTEVEIEEALNSIAHSESYEKTIDVMSNQMDAKSRNIISENPSYIGSLNQDIESGVYSEVMENVQYQRDMKLIPAGTSDIEAYIYTVQIMAQQRAQGVPSGTEPEQQPNSGTERKEVRRKKKSMGTSRSKPSGRAKKQYDPLLMSDEDFMKLEGVSTL